MFDGSTSSSPTKRKTKSPARRSSVKKKKASKVGTSIMVHRKSSDSILPTLEGLIERKNKFKYKLSCLENELIMARDFYKTQSEFNKLLI
jgi:hypothetical protein